MNQKYTVVLASAVATLVLLPIRGWAAPQKLPSYCPPPGTVVPLTKVMNRSFVKDFKGCDIVVEATFLMTGGFLPSGSGYDTKKNTIFRVLEPGGVLSALAGTAKASSDILFQFKQGDLLLLRGAPVSLRFLAGESVFHATSVTRKP